MENKPTKTQISKATVATLKEMCSTAGLTAGLTKAKKAEMQNNLKLHYYGYDSDEEKKPAKKKDTEYEKLHLYFEDGKFKFELDDQPTVEEFTELIGETIYPVAQCVLNTPENFPYKMKKDNTPYKHQREYLKDDPAYKGKKVDYKALNETMWNDNENEWLYCLVYDGRIVKIGMTITDLKERWCGSYSCGTSRAMAKGSCSTTNFIITECNYEAVKSGKEVLVYGICCPKKEEPETRFGITKNIYTSKVRGLETMLSQVFHNAYNHKPVLCVQEGKQKMKSKQLKTSKNPKKGTFFYCTRFSVLQINYLFQ